MDWMLESPIVQLLEDITPITIEEIDEYYVQTLTEFIDQAHHENEVHKTSIGTYRLDLFVVREYAFMKLRTYVDGRLDPDTDEGQLYMLQNYWQEFIESATSAMQSLSGVVIQDIKTWQRQLQDLV